MSISWYECDNIAQIHVGSNDISLYGQGEIAESQGKVREFLFPDPVGTLYDCNLS